jgi:hypothetical protein
MRRYPGLFISLHFGMSRMVVHTEGCAWVMCPIAWRYDLLGGVLPKGLSWVANLHGACGRFTVPVFGGSSE